VSTKGTSANRSVNRYKSNTNTDSNIYKNQPTVTVMSVSNVTTSGRKRTASQRALENADPLVLRKKALVSIVSSYLLCIQSKILTTIFFFRTAHLI
jgi:hypothetical protein